MITSPFSFKSIRNLHTATVWARDLKFLQNLHLPPCVMCHLSNVMCQVSNVTCHLSPIKCVWFFLDKVVELVGGRLVINKANFASFRKYIARYWAVSSSSQKWPYISSCKVLKIVWNGLLGCVQSKNTAFRQLFLVPFEQKKRCVICYRHFYQISTPGPSWSSSRDVRDFVGSQCIFLSLSFYRCS